MILSKNGFTHGGKFHADDVFSTALLMMLQPDFRVTRGFKAPENFDGIVYDIGGGEFDHHQEPREYRPNGVPYAAFGKLWRHFGIDIVHDNVSTEIIDSLLVQPIDAVDNGVENADRSLSEAIGAFNPCWDEDNSFVAQMGAFDDAVDIAYEIMESVVACIMQKRIPEKKETFLDTVLNCLPEISKDVVYTKIADAMKRKEDAKLRAEKIAEDAKKQAKNSTVIVLDQYAPIIGMLCETEALAMVYPSQRGGWNAQLVPVEPEGFATKAAFPKEWWGASRENLPEGVTFCHANGFMLAAETKEDAIKAARMAKV